MADGFIRESVKITQDNSFVSVQFSVWNLDLPKNWVDQTPDLWSLFNRDISVHQINYGSPELQSLVSLLDAQGCFSYPDTKPAYTYKEIKQIFLSICSVWYGKYYSHPLWNRLREGRLTKNGLVAWLLHNYHLSRSAGKTAARSATRLSNVKARRLFQFNVLEEYSHYHDFYFVNHPNLSLEDEQVKSYLHLPSGLALEQQKLRIAEDDWLAHVLISLFQESTVRFYEQCKDFYRLVENKYDIEGFFHSWEEHIQLDLEYGHESQFSDFLESDEYCSREELIRSLYNSSFTFEFLVGCLDDILAEDTEDALIKLRNPVSGGQLIPEDTTLLKSYSNLTERRYHFENENALDFFNRLRALGLLIDLKENSAARQILENDAEYLLQDLVNSFYKCVGYARQHDDLMLFGRLIERVPAKYQHPPAGFVGNGFQAYSPYTQGIANFFNELIINPTYFAFVFYYAAKLAESDPTSINENQPNSIHSIPINDSGISLLEEFLTNQILPLEAKDRLINLILEFNELYEKWINTRAKEKPINFFCY